jgi:NADPH oxidase
MVRPARFLFQVYSLHDTDRCRLNIVHGPKLPGLSRLKYSVLISRGAAVPLSLDLMLLLLPMCRILGTQLRLIIKWIPLEEAAWFHRQVAYTMLFYTITHVSAHYVK